MNVVNLIEQCTDSGVFLYVEEGALCFELSVDEFPSKLKEEVLANKEAIIANLSQTDEVHAVDKLTCIKRVDNDSNRAPLAFSQQRLWFIEKMAPEQCIYHMPTMLKLEGLFNITALEQAATYIIQRHEPLRTTFAEFEGEIQQVVSDSFDFKINSHDLTSVDIDSKERELRFGLLSALNCPFDLENDLMIRGDWFLLSESESGIQGVLLLNMHHIVSDGWSMKIFSSELIKAYLSIMEKKAVEFDDLSIRYRDYAHWQREFLSETLRQEQLNYWQDQLADLPLLHNLPLDFPRPKEISFDGGVFTQRLPVSLVTKVAEFALQRGLTPFMVIHGVYNLLLSHYSNSMDIVIGTPIASRQDPALAPLIGLFVNMLTLRSKINPSDSLSQYFAQIKKINLDAQSHQDFPFEFLVDQLEIPRSSQYSPVFQVCLMMENEEENIPFNTGISPFSIDTDVIAKFDLTLDVKWSNEQCTMNWEYASSLFKHSSISKMAQHFEHLLETVIKNPTSSLKDLSVMTHQEYMRICEEAKGPQVDYDRRAVIHRMFEQQVIRNPNAIALIFFGCNKTYGELNAEANQLAHYLHEKGVTNNTLVGICIERSTEMVVAMLAILKAGGAYVPLDISHPQSRLDFIREDAKLKFLLTQDDIKGLFIDEIKHIIAIDGQFWKEKRNCYSQINLSLALTPDNPSSLAYVCYTSGSTGRPKGVLIEHRNVINYFTALNQHFRTNPRHQTWLAVTSLSFDISVTELLWTLISGQSVVLQPEKPIITEDFSDVDFSLFYFAAEKDDKNPGKSKYQLLLEGAAFADANEMSAIWVPERHFSAFGSPFPNPSVAAAAVAVKTNNLKIRAGSVVLPLHNTLRVAEEWSMVDNFSNGRVELSIASGWHPNDFVLAPDKFEDRHQHMRDSIQTLQQLWQGESIVQTNGIGDEVAVKLYPKPTQNSLPVWVTAAYSPDTFRYAGSIGANVLTHLLGQSSEQLNKNIEIYRESLEANGFEAESGRVALMLHTFVSDDDEKIEQIVKEPFKQYLQHSANLLKPFAEEAGLSLEKDLDAILELAFQRFFHISGLCGTPQQCLSRIQELSFIGVDEIACLIDFGVEHETVLQNLPSLKRLQNLVKKEHIRNRALAKREQNYTSSHDLVMEHQVTHLQCTPQFISSWINSERGKAAYNQLTTLMIGGESTSSELARLLLESGNAKVFNMYGPTESTVWSAISEIQNDQVSIGSAIANTALYVINSYGQFSPDGVAGELCIAGDGLAKGYLNHQKLTKQCFVDNPFDKERLARMYFTGDLVRRLPDGRFQFIERMDDQVKILGHRIELGEVQEQLATLKVVKSSCVVCHEGESGNKYLIGYVTVLARHDGLEREIFSDLKNLLPHFMLPSKIIILDAFPLTVHGKIDKRRLPSPENEDACHASHISPRNDIEAQIEHIWRQTLMCDKVSVFANFFSLGGNSLHVVQVRDMICNEFLVKDSELTLIALFNHQTIAAQAELISNLQITSELNNKMVELGDDLDELEEEFF